MFILPLQASAQPTIPGLKSQAPSSLASVPNPRLLLPGDFTGIRPGPGSDTAGVYLGPVSASSAQVSPGTWNPWVQPGPRREDGQDRSGLVVLAERILSSVPLFYHWASGSGMCVRRFSNNDGH